MATTTKRKNRCDVTRASIRRSVASSTAIETGESIPALETKLKRNRKKYSHITLAS